MRRTLFYSLAVVLAAIAAFAAFRMARQPIVVGRAVIGGPPPQVVRMAPAPSLVGKPAPAFAAVDLSGSPVSSEALRGRVLLVDVWATWCKPCTTELPRIDQEIWRKHPADVAVVAVAWGENAEKVRAYNQAAGLTFPLVPDPERKISRPFGGDAPIPRTYVVSRAGVIVDQHTGYGDASFNELVASVEREIARQ